LIATTKFGRAIVSFPKMKLSYEADLVNSLKKLGMNAAFYESSADFKAMGTAAKNIFINQIKHKAVLEVDEKGAEGAAVTAVGFGITSLPPVLNFNKSYYLVLRNLKTNTILFIGFVGKDPLG
jgi:serine protease inhibitor